MEEKIEQAGISFHFSVETIARMNDLLLRMCCEI